MTSFLCAISVGRVAAGGIRGGAHPDRSRRAAGHEVPKRPAEHQPTWSDQSRPWRRLLTSGPRTVERRRPIMHGGRDRGRRPLSDGLVEPNLLDLQNRQAHVAHALVGSTPAPLRSPNPCKSRSARSASACHVLGLQSAAIEPGRSESAGGCFQTCERRSRHSFCTTTALEMLRNATQTSFGLLPQARRRAAWRRDVRPSRAGGELRRWITADRARPFGERWCAGRRARSPDTPAVPLGQAQVRIYR